LSSISANAIVIDEVTTASSGSGGRRTHRSDARRSTGDAETSAQTDAAIVRFFVQNITEEIALLSSAVLSDRVADGSLASSLTSAGIGSNPDVEYAVEASLHSASVETILMDCLGVIDGSAVSDPCGVCNGDGSTCAPSTNESSCSSVTCPTGLCPDGSDRTEIDGTCCECPSIGCDGVQAIYMANCCAQSGNQRLDVSVRFPAGHVVLNPTCRDLKRLYKRGSCCSKYSVRRFAPLSILKPQSELT